MKEYYLVDASSERYFVGKIRRLPGQMLPAIEALKPGETWWNPKEEGLGLERIK